LAHVESKVIVVDFVEPHSAPDHNKAVKIIFS